MTRPFLARYEIDAPDVTDMAETAATETGPGSTKTGPSPTPPHEPDTMFDAKDVDW